jgi:hypothetical protein
LHELAQPVVFRNAVGGFSTTAGAFDTSHDGAFDGFVTRLEPAGSALTEDPRWVAEATRFVAALENKEPRRTFRLKMIDLHRQGVTACGIAATASPRIQVHADAPAVQLYVLGRAPLGVAPRPSGIRRAIRRTRCRTAARRVVARGDRFDVVGHVLHPHLVRRSLERLLEPVLDAGRREGEHDPRRLRAGVLEAVHGTAGDVDEVARPGDDRLLAEQELNLALEQIEGLVLAGVDVGGPAARGHERLHREVGAAGLLAGDEKRVVVARPPECASGSMPEQRAIWRVFLECGYALIDILDAELQAEAAATSRARRARNAGPRLRSNFWRSASEDPRICNAVGHEYRGANAKTRMNPWDRM